VTSLNETSFDAYIQEADKPVLVDFYRDGCLPCRRVSPLVSKTETQYGDRILVARINIDQSKKLAEKLRIEAAPTLIIFGKDGELARHRGVIDGKSLSELVENYI
jgi:thioredoxin 1